jgi:hypothetical protein
VAVLARNRLEWAESYAACAKAGLVAAPINFRLGAAEAAFIMMDAGAACVPAEEGHHGVVEESAERLSPPPGRFVHFGAPVAPRGWRRHEDVIAASRAGRHQARDPGDVPELGPVRTSWFVRGRLGDHAPPRRAVRPPRRRRSRMPGFGAYPPARRRRARGAGRRTGRAAFLRAPHLRRLPEPAGQDVRGLPRRPEHGGRHGRAPRGRLRPTDRPQQEHDRLGRREHLPFRGRGRGRGRGRARGSRRRDGGRRGRSSRRENGASASTPSLCRTRARRRARTS